MKHKLLTALIALAAVLCLCFGLAGCGRIGGNEERGEDGHVHVAQTFNVDENGHWKVCTVCGEQFSVGKHNYNSDNTCKTCGYSTVYTEGLEYRLDEDTDTYTVTGLGEATEVTDLIIPAYHEGKAVTSIGSYVFHNCTGLTSVMIPDSVTLIGDDAFKDCSRLTSITIPDSVTSIGWLAFKGTAHYNDAANWDSAGVLYIGNHLIEAKKDIISGSYIVKQGTKTIAGCAFAGGEESDSLLYLRGCLNLTSIVIPNSVTLIGDDAFSSCRGLTSIVIPDSVTSIGDSTFSRCSGLTSIVIPDSVTLIGDDAFAYCSGLTSIVIPDSVTHIGSEAFYSCSKLTSIVIPDSVTSIGEYAFSRCSELTSIEIPDSVTSIGRYAFYKCNNLIQNEGYIDYVDQWAIGCSSTATEVTIRAGTKGIADQAFHYCSGLKSVAIPGSVTSIGKYAFDYCTGLTGELKIPDSVTEIGYGAFEYCTGLTGELKIPDSVTEIGNGAFSDCRGLTSATIGSGVTSIGDRAFSGCSSLEHIIVAKGNNAYRSAQDCLIETKSNTLILGCQNSMIPDGVTLIGDYAFYYCDKLTSITIPDSVTSIEKGAFWLCTGLTSIVIPDSVTEIGDSAFFCSGLTSVTMSDSVTSIGDRAFGCGGLTDIYFDGTIEKWREIEEGPWLVTMPDKTVVHCTDGDCNRRGDLIQS